MLRSVEHVERSVGGSRLPARGIPINRPRKESHPFRSRVDGSWIGRGPAGSLPAPLSVGLLEIDVDFSEILGYIGSHATRLAMPRLLALLLSRHL